MTSEIQSNRVGRYDNVARVRALRRAVLGMCVGIALLGHAQQDAVEPTTAVAASAAPSTPPPVEQPQADDTVLAQRSELDALLNRGPEEERRSERCVRSTAIEETDVLNGHLIVFTDSRDNIYINQMPVNCPGLKPGAKVAYLTRGDGRVCQLDSIRVLLPAGIGVGTAESAMIGPSCMLGKFEPITKDQLDVLKERYTPDGKNALEELFESIF